MPNLSSMQYSVYCSQHGVSREFHSISEQTIMKRIFFTLQVPLYGERWVADRFSKLLEKCGKIQKENIQEFLEIRFMFLVVHKLVKNQNSCCLPPLNRSFLETFWMSEHKLHMWRTKHCRSIFTHYLILILLNLIHIHLSWLR